MSEANKEALVVDTVENLKLRLDQIRAAQREFATYPQEKVDEIFKAAALAANAARIPLAQQAVAETGMGVMEDKVIKNNYASEYIYNKYKDTKTCGVIDEDKAFGTKRIAEPVTASSSAPIRVPSRAPSPPRRPSSTLLSLPALRKASSAGSTSRPSSSPRPS